MSCSQELIGNMQSQCSFCTTNLEIVFLAQRFFSSRLGNQLFEGGVTRREDGIEDQTSVFGDLITMRVGKFLNQPVGARNSRSFRLMAAERLRVCCLSVAGVEYNRRCISRFRSPWMVNSPRLTASSNAQSPGSNGCKALTEVPFQLVRRSMRAVSSSRVALSSTLASASQ